MSPLDGALWLVRHGFAVFPADHPGTEQCTGVGRGHDPATCTDRGKHPCVPFSRTHSRDEAQVHAWFEDGLRNVAVPVSATPGPDGARLVVLDSDRAGAIEDAAAAFGHRHTPTMRVRTAKGTHDHYWTPASVRLGNGLGSLRGKFDGDVRAGNAYVISVGSVHATGVIYELEDPEQPPVPMPAWLLTALQAPYVPPAPPRHEGGAQVSGGSLVGLVRFVLDSAQGQRNERLFWASCRAFERCRKGQMEPRAVATALVDAAARIGLSKGEARDTVRSAYRSAGGTR